MMAVNPKKRYNIHTVLNHPWFEDSELKDRIEDLYSVLESDINSHKSSLRIFRRNFLKILNKN